jgi:uncharacterized protein with HEPN domain
MSKDPEFYLGHILESIEKIERFAEGLDKDEFLGNDLVLDAVVRNIEIIGEAAKNLPKEFKTTHAEIPWKEIAGMRDRIAHFYFGIDFEIVWDTIQKDIPELKEKITSLIK